MKKLIVAALAGLLAASPASATALLSDYDVYSSGNAFISGGSYGVMASGSFTNANGPTGKNFVSNTAATAALTKESLDRSAAYAALAATGTITSGQWTPGDVTLTGLTSGINVFNIDGSQWSQLYKLTFAGIGEGAIVNVSGLSLTNYIDLKFGSLADASKVLFNFHGADTVTMNGMTVKGSILAPKAAVTLQGGEIFGQVVDKTFHSEGTKIRGTGFADFAQTRAATAPPVPEPSTWIIMITGFALVGASMRRRRPAALGLAAA